MEALHQQLRAVAVDGQTAGAFLAAVEQAIAISALAVQLGQQIVTIIEGGAQRLIQGRHALRLGGQIRRGSLTEQTLSALPGTRHSSPMRRRARCTEPLRTAQRKIGAVLFTHVRTSWRVTGRCSSSS